jgi:hypothetical protein
VFIENKFPIVAPEQREASFFPWYSMAIFAGILTPLLALLQWLLPSFPWFFAGFSALAASLMLYEILHAIAERAVRRRRALARSGDRSALAIVATAATSGCRPSRLSGFGALQAASSNGWRHVVRRLRLGP